MVAQINIPVPFSYGSCPLAYPSFNNQFQYPYVLSVPTVVPTTSVVPMAAAVQSVPHIPKHGVALAALPEITVNPAPLLASRAVTSAIATAVPVGAVVSPMATSVAEVMQPTTQPTKQPTTQISRRTSPLTSQRTGLGPSKVLNLVHLPLDTDVPQLERTLEKQVGCKVVRSLAAWNKASLLVELEELVRLPERRTPVGTCGVQALASRKKDVVAVPTSTVLNVRFYVLDPFQDYKGTEREREMHRRALRDFAGLCPAGFDMQLGAAMQESGRETWSEMASPLQPQRMLMAEGGKKLLYTQLFFVYDDEDMSTRAAALSDGSVHTVGNLRMVIRAEFSRPHAIDAAPRAWNPALWPRGGSAPEPYGPN
eukprot:Hpha_TRINITY_DN14324_c0_g1::TRINITY_DN14324_c0_g1_i2::g.87089::m.87089